MQKQFLFLLQSNAIVLNDFEMFFNVLTRCTHNFRILIKRPARDACLCMGELQAPAAPPAPHFVFLITL